jgi:flagellar hook-length control protein FliK
MQVSESFSLPTGVSSNSLILNALPIATADVVAGENYLAEKVAYWISSDIQNAEMKLDGFGNDLVEVSISMQGNEAHVAFRTDETQARMALENASTHLKELLQREGLVLSGVSVGASGAGDSHAQERRSSRQVPKHALVALALEARGNGGRDLAHLTGRSLDLFV